MSCVDSTKGVLFKGYQNKLIVFGLDSDSVLLLNISGDTLKRYTNESPFYYRPRRGMNDTIRVFSNGLEVFRKGFENHYVGSFHAYLGNLNDSIVEKEELLKNLKLRLKYEYPNFKNKGSIRRFTSKIVKKDGSVIICNNEAWEKVNHEDFIGCEFLDCLTLEEERNYFMRDEFTPNQIEKISIMDSGDTLYIEKVWWCLPSSCIGVFKPNLKFIIK